MENKFSCRHGDLYLEQIGKLPQGSKIKKGNVILSASHDHIIEGEGKIYSQENDIFVKVTGKANLNHSEHGEIELPEGIYKVIRQVQSTPYDGIINVED